MECNFKPGDWVVHHENEDTVMMIQDIGNGAVKCLWFDEEQKTYNSKKFPEGQLKKYVEHRKKKGASSKVEIAPLTFNTMFS